MTLWCMETMNNAIEWITFSWRDETHYDVDYALDACSLWISFISSPYILCKSAKTSTIDLYIWSLETSTSYITYMFGEKPRLIKLDVCASCTSHPPLHSHIIGTRNSLWWDTWLIHMHSYNRGSVCVWLYRWSKQPHLFTFVSYEYLGYHSLIWHTRLVHP